MFQPVEYLWLYSTRWLDLYGPEQSTSGRDTNRHIYRHTHKHTLYLARYKEDQTGCICIYVSICIFTNIIFQTSFIYCWVFLWFHMLFNRVIQFGEKNRMSAQSVAIVFGPTLLRPEVESANITMYMIFQTQIVEFMLKETDKIFQAWQVVHLMKASQGELQSESCRVRTAEWELMLFLKALCTYNLSMSMLWRMGQVVDNSYLQMQHVLIFLSSANPWVNEGGACILLH